MVCSFGRAGLLSVMVVAGLVVRAADVRLLVNDGVGGDFLATAATTRSPSRSETGG